MLGKRYQCLVVVFVVLAVFYPILIPDFCRIDDQDMVNAFKGMQGWSLKGIFVPGSEGGLYYRPLVMVTFLIGKYWHGLDPWLMHLENVLLHLFNALTVFFICRETLQKERDSSYLPLVAALCFALHPINTESVNWISGRTDLLAAAFVLPSALLLLKYRSGAHWCTLALSLLAFLLGMLSKEVSLAFLPGFLLIFRAASQRDADTPSRSGFSSLLRQNLYISAAALAALGAFFLLRFFAFSSNYSRIGMTLRAIFIDPVHSSTVALRAFGFYLKKLYLPLPLNFAIVEVDPLYEILAMVLLPLCLYIVTRRNRAAALFGAGIFLLAPSFLIAFNQVAWTPYAERYVYLSSGFLVVATLCFLKRNLLAPRLAKVALVLVLLSAAGSATFARNLTWSRNLALAEDTVRVSPYSKDMRVLYGALLAESGDYGNALAQSRLARALPSMVYDDRADLNIAYIVYRQGDPEQARRISERVLKQTGGKSVKAYDNLINLYEEKSARASAGDRTLLDQKLLELNLASYRLTGNPQSLYKAGAVCLRVGDKKRALEYLTRAYRDLDAGDRYRDLAAAALKRIKS